MKNLSPEKSLCENKWSYPVVHLPRGEFRFCCRAKGRRISEEELQREGKNVFLNSEYEKERRLEMLTGVRHGDCAVCWRLEDKGQKSPRIHYDDFPQKQGWQKKMPLGEWEQLAREAPQTAEWQESKRPQIVEIMLSNICDMKCVYCSHHYSSRWGQELVEFGEIQQNRMAEEFPKPEPSFEPLFWEAMEKDIAPNAYYFNILGGEPLINDKLYVLMDKLYEITRRHGRMHMNLTVVTNLNCSEQQLDRFIEKYRSYKGWFLFDFNISMESFGPRSEYIRHGLNWERWLANFEKILEARLSPFSISMQMATNALSITSLKDLLVLVKSLVDKYDQPIRLRQNLVSDPAHLCPYILTPDFASYLDESITYLRTVQDDMRRFNFFEWGRWDFYADFLQSIRDSIANGQADNESRRRFYDFIQTNDSRRKLDFLSVFPEYAQFYGLCMTSQDPK